jgi:hypothetical protein
MRTRIIIAVSLLLIASIALQVTGAKNNSSVKARSLTRQTLEDKIRGGWAGQMIGVSFGAPTEFNYNGKIIEGEIKWKPEMVSNAIVQDDLYVEMTFTEVMDRIGLNATTEQYGEAFKDSRYQLWHANAGARRLLNQGIKAPWSGHPKYNLHANDIDFQIESDFIGMMTPGLPQEANKYADRVGHVMNFGDGVYGGMFFAGMYAAAFFENDPRKVVEIGLASIPAQSGYAMVVRDVLNWSAQNPEDWKKTWQLLKDKWDKDDPCTEGALAPFNIDARLNGAHVVLGLLYGKGDFTRTVDVSTRAGQDSDCNPSSAAGVLGVMLGYGKIPDEWKSGIAAIADKKFDYTNYSFNTITESTVKRALQVIQMAGGKVTDIDVTIPPQEPKAWKLEQWSPGIPDKLVNTDDAAWQWKGDWVNETAVKHQQTVIGKAAKSAGAEASLKFNGVALVLVGPLSQEGGRADIYLDGKKARQLDAFIPERTTDDALWHIYGLKPGAHTVRIVRRDDADARSKGKRIVIQRAITFRGV